jgi:hypothetical protein
MSEILIADFQLRGIKPRNKKPHTFTSSTEKVTKHSLRASIGSASHIIAHSPVTVYRNAGLLDLSSAGLCFFLMPTDIGALLCSTETSQQGSGRHYRNKQISSLAPNSPGVISSRGSRSRSWKNSYPSVGGLRRSSRCSNRSKSTPKAKSVANWAFSRVFVEQRISWAKALFFKAETKVEK